MSSKDIVANEGKIAFDSFKKLKLPLDRDQIRTLKVGDYCLLTGAMYTLRDAGHMRLLEELDAQGIAATVGKGTRSQAVKDACVRNGAVYFVTVGGAAAYLAKCITSEEVLAYDDLGTEALRRIEVVDFPVFVGIDVQGSDIYESRER